MAFVNPNSVDAGRRRLVRIRFACLNHIVCLAERALTSWAPNSAPDIEIPSRATRYEISKRIQNELTAYGFGCRAHTVRCNPSQACRDRDRKRESSLQIKPKLGLPRLELVRLRRSDGRTHLKAQPARLLSVVGRRSSVLESRVSSLANELERKSLPVAQFDKDTGPFSRFDCG